VSVDDAVDPDAGVQVDEVEDADALDADDGPESPAPSRFAACLGVGAGVALAVVLAALLIGVVVGRTFDRGSDRSSFPGEDSVDVGFARDMGAHHAQAVEIAELLRDRSDDPGLKRIASDIALTQQAQIGQMRGWLDIWGRPPTSVEPPMGWMGHEDVAGAVVTMPGMASDDEIAALTAAHGAEAERLFLELMIRHHRGGVQMASYAADHAEDSIVRTLARGMVEAQTAEIAQLEELLTTRFGEPAG
jgi:uncharacterized protein (DUF305 family)